MRFYVTFIVYTFLFCFDYLLLIINHNLLIVILLKLFMLILIIIDDETLFDMNTCTTGDT